MVNRADRRAGQRRAVAEARNVMQQLASGRLDVADLERQTADEARRLFGTVAGPGDPLWPLQVEVCHRVLEVGGGISTDELAEWVAVYRAAEAEAAAVANEPSSAAIEVQPPYSLLGALSVDDSGDTGGSGADGAVAGDGGAGGVRGDDVPVEVEVEVE